MFEFAYYTWSICSLVAAVALVIYRVRRVRRWRVPLDVVTQLESEILREARSRCGGPGLPIAMRRDHWSTHRQPFETLLLTLARLHERNRIGLAGYDFHFHGMVLRQLPSSLSLTPDAYRELSPRQEPVIVYGPANFGDGPQVNQGTFSPTVDLRGPKLDEFVMDVYAEANRHNEELAAQLRKAADLLSDAVEQNELRGGPARSALRWIAGLASGTAASVVSAGIIAAATALLNSMNGDS